MQNHNMIIVDPLVQYANNLIQIVIQSANDLISLFININSSIRKYRKITEKLRGNTTKKLISQLLIALEIQT